MTAHKSSSILVVDRNEVLGSKRRNALQYDFSLPSKYRAIADEMSTPVRLVSSDIVFWM